MAILFAPLDASPRRDCVGRGPRVFGVGDDDTTGRHQIELGPYYMSNGIPEGMAELTVT